MIYERGRGSIYDLDANKDTTQETSVPDVMSSYFTRDPDPEPVRGGRGNIVEKPNERNDYLASIIANQTAETQRNDSVPVQQNVSVPIPSQFNANEYADELRYAREQVSPFNPLYQLNQTYDKNLASQNRRPLAGGLFSKEIGSPGIGSVQFEGYSGIGNMLSSMAEPIVRAIDAPYSSYLGLIPKEDMTGEAFGTAGLATAGGGLMNVRPNQNTVTMSGGLGSVTKTLPEPKNRSEAMAKEILELRAQGRASEVTEEMMEIADDRYLFNNTPIDMSEAARMQRLKDMGYNVDRTLYHGTGGADRDSVNYPPIQSFRFQTDGTFSTPSPELADSYAPRAAMSVAEKDPLERKASGIIYPLVARDKGTYKIDTKRSNYTAIKPDDYPDELDFLFERDFNLPYFEYKSPTTSGLMLDAKDKIGDSFKGVDLENIYDVGGYTSYGHKYPGDTKSSYEFRIDEQSKPQTVVIRNDPKDYKSIYSRADPEFQHLSNILAANRSKAAGTLFMNMGDEGALMEFPDIGRAVDDYVNKFNVPGSFNSISQALKSDNYPLYKDVLKNNLDKTFGDNKINVTRIEGYSDPFAQKTKTSFQIDKDDVLFVGNPDEKELIIKTKDGRAQSVMLDDDFETMLVEDQPKIKSLKDEISDFLNKGNLSQYNFRKQQMIKSGISGNKLENNLTRLARELGIERPE